MNKRQSVSNACRPLILGSTALLLATTSFAQAPSIDWDLGDAIRQIDRQVSDFQTAMVRVEATVTDADGNETTRSTGTAFIRRDGRIRYNVDGGNVVVLVDKNYVQIYNKEENQVEEIRLSQNRDRIEPFARLGFSTSGRDLKDDFLITILGEEEIGDSRTLVLELTPKRDRVRETVRLVRLWIDQASWMPLRQEFSRTQGGETVTNTFSGMARNLELNPDLFKDNWPRGTEKIKK